MIQSKYFWLLPLIATASGTPQEYFYGKNGLSKLHVNKVTAEKNCGCSGSWDSTQFIEISKHFGGQLHDIVPKEVTTAHGHKDASPLSIGSNTYTLSLDYSSGYSRPGSSDTAVWNRLVSEMLLVANRTLDRTIITGEYVNALGGSHNITLTVYDDKGCVNNLDPCIKSEPQDAKHGDAVRAAARTSPALDWSDKESVVKNMKLKIYNTSSLDEAVWSGGKLPQYIYHDDLHAVIDTSTIAPVHKNTTELDKRQYCIPYGFYRYWGDGQWSTWGQWLPVSSCLWTGYSPSGGSQSLNIGYSMSFAESFNFGWNGVKSGLNAGFSFSITESYSQSLTYSCNIPGYSVGQLWMQQFVGAGYVYRESCFSGCGSTRCDHQEGPNYSAAPASGVYSFGCSTGAERMACAAYRNNWVAYSVWSHTPPQST